MGFGYTGVMKTAVSIPDDVFDGAEAFYRAIESLSDLVIW
jgi:hypothetical protein